MKADQFIHVIVATGEWGQDQLRYRRHRLAEFLAGRKETKEVIWVCPSENPSLDNKHYKETLSSLDTLPTYVFEKLVYLNFN